MRDCAGAAGAACANSINCSRGISNGDIRLASDAEKNAFATLLDEQDPELWNWFSGRTAPPDAWKRIVDEIRTADRV